MPFTFQIGEDVRLFLAVVGDASEAAGVSVTADLKLAGGNGAVPSPATPPVCAFDVIAASSDQAGWYLILPAAETATLDQRYYVVNARLTYPNGAVEITDPLVLSFRWATT